MQMYYRVLDHLNTSHSANLEKSFKLPKIKGNFKGTHRPIFVEADIHSGKSGTSANIIDASNESDEKSGNTSTILPSFSGWMKREEGTLMRKLKERYIVVKDLMIMWTDGPNAETPRGVMPLTATTRVSTVHGKGKKELQANQIYISNVADKSDMLLEANTSSERDRWVAILEKHIDHAATMSYHN